MEAFGVNITDEMYAQLESRVAYAPYTTAAVAAGLLPAVRTRSSPASSSASSGMLMGGAGTFKQVFAILAHGGVITALQMLFAMPLSYATGRLAGATLDVFVPMLEETSFLARFLGGLDLFWMWWCVSIAIGVGVLFKRRTGGIAMTFLSIYVVVVLVVRAAARWELIKGTYDNSDQDRHRGGRRAGRSPPWRPPTSTTAATAACRWPPKPSARGTSKPSCRRRARFSPSGR